MKTKTVCNNNNNNFKTKNSEGELNTLEIGFGTYGLWKQAHQFIVQV